MLQRAMASGCYGRGAAVVAVALMAGICLSLPRGIAAQASTPAPTTTPGPALDEGEIVGAVTDVARQERAAADARLRAAAAKAEDMQKALTVLLTYEAQLVTTVRASETSVSDGNAEVAAAQLQLSRLKAGGATADALRAASTAEVDGLRAAVDEANARVVALRQQQVSTLTAALERGDAARQAEWRQRELLQDIRSLSRRIAAGRGVRDRENATLVAAEGELAVTQNQLQMKGMQRAQQEDDATKARVTTSESISALNELKRDVDMAAASIRASNIALVGEVDELIKRRDQVQLRRDSLRREVTLLGVIVRQLNETETGRRTELEDVQMELARTIDLRDHRRATNANFAAFKARIDAEVTTLQRRRDELMQAAIPALRSQLSNMTRLRDRFAAELARLNANITADDEVVENLRATRTTLRQRLLDLKNEVVAAQFAVKRLRVAVADAAGERGEAAAAITAADDRSRRLLVKIGNIQAELENAEVKARARWLRRRHECQCDDLRFAGASTAAIAKCMRKCADAVVVASTVLMELSSPEQAQRDARTATSPTRVTHAEAHLARFRAADLDAGDSAAMPRLHHHLVAAAAEAEGLDHAAIADAIAAVSRASSPSLSANAAAAVIDTAGAPAFTSLDAEGLWAAHARASLSRERLLTLQAAHLDAVAQSEAGADVEPHIFRFRATTLSGVQAAQSPSLETAAASLDSRVAAIASRLAAANDRINAILSREDSSMSEQVARLSGAVAGELTDADAEVVLRDVLRRVEDTRAREAAAGAVTAGHDGDGGSARQSSRLARFRSVQASDRQPPLRPVSDPLAAVTNSKAADVEARAASLERDFNTKQASVADLETRRALLASQVAEAGRRVRALRSEIADTTAALPGVAQLVPDPQLAALIGRRDILRNQLVTVRRQAAEVQDRVSLMVSAMGAADAQHKRLLEDVARLQAVRDGLKEEGATLDSTVASVRFNAQARRRDVLYSGNELKRVSEADERAARRMQERLAEMRREESSLDSYYKFMVDANAKLRGHVADLRARKDDLVSAEAAINEEVAATDAQLTSFRLQQSQLLNSTAALLIALGRTRANLNGIAKNLVAETTRGAALQESAADAALSRDKLRTDEVRWTEESDSLRRQIVNLLRKSKELNETMTEARAQLKEKVRLKAAMLNSVFDISDGLREANATLVGVRNDSALAAAVLSTTGDAVRVARQQLVKKQVEVRTYTASYRKLLQQLGRLPDISVTDVRFDDASKAEEVKMIAGKEARSQADSFSSDEGVDELIGEWEPDNSVAVPSPSPMVAAGAAAARTTAPQVRSTR